METNQNIILNHERLPLVLDVSLSVSSPAVCLRTLSGRLWSIDDPPSDGPFISRSMFCVRFSVVAPVKPIVEKSRKQNTFIFADIYTADYLLNETEQQNQYQHENTEHEVVTSEFFLYL